MNVTQSEGRKRKANIVYHLYVESRKNDTDELICRAETDIQM